MHVILGALGALVTILILLKRLSDAGVDLGWLDPIKWQRRRKWKQQYNEDPVFSIDDPMKATAGLMYTMVKCSGDISREEKSFLLSVFSNDFQLTDAESTDLLSTCSFYIKDENLVKNQLKKFISPSLNNFSDSQKKSAVTLITKVASCEGKPNDKQSEFLFEIIDIFQPKQIKSKW